MHPPFRTFAFSLGFVTLMVTAAAGQSMQVGQWTGTVYPPDVDPVAVTFEVREDGDQLAITMHDTPMGSIEFMDVKLSGTTLAFWWNIGVTLNCKLERTDDGGYTGPCTDDEGVPGTIVMVPPEP